MSEGIQIAMGIGIALLLAVLVFVAGWMVVVVKRLETAFVSIDRVLVPFGQSGLGRLANTASLQARGYFDQASDPAVIQIATLLSSVNFVARWAKAAGIEITPGRVAIWGRALFDTLDNLTDGVAEAEAAAARAAEANWAEAVVKAAAVGAEACEDEGLPIPERETLPRSGKGL